jgi:tRNA 5-methylaminomethyl-2-thiouridine biosynthesis bifunctional protein
VVCAQSYITPAAADLHCVGASYVKNSTDTTLTMQEHQQNFEGICSHIKSLDAGGCTDLSGRASIRGSTRDHLPILGQLPDPGRWKNDHVGSRYSKAAVLAPDDRFFPGLYINVGHGSHGLATTPLAGEYLASLIAGEPSPFQNSVSAYIAPERFLERARRRQVRHSTGDQHKTGRLPSED